MTVRAKFRVDTVITEKQPNYESSTIKMSPVCDDSTEENKSFWEATPAGSIELRCANKKAVEQFIPGQTYYVDFTKAE